MKHEVGDVEIVVAIPPIVSVETGELEQALSKYVTELCTDVGTSVRPRVSVVTGADRHHGWEPPFRVTIGGEPCRINRERPASTWPHVVADVLQTIVDNKALLFDDDALATVVDACATSAPRQSAVAACREALGMGLPASRMPALLGMFEVGTPEEHWIEEGIAAAFDTGIRVHAAPDTLAVFQGLKTPDGDSLEATVQLARVGMFFELGVIFGTVELVPDASLVEATYRFELNGVRQPPLHGVTSDHVLVNDTPKRLHDLLGLDAVPARNPANFTGAGAVAREAEALCITAGLTTWDARGYMVLSLASLVRRHAAQFLTLTQVDRSLAAIWQSQPQLVQAVQSVCSTARLCRILRKLLFERVSILDIGLILESLLILYAQTNDEPSLDQAVAHVRDRLSTQIRHDLGADSELACILLAEDLETRLAGRSLSDFTVDERHVLVEAIGRRIATDEGPRSGDKKIVLVVGSANRANVRALIATEFPGVAVLTYHELLRRPDPNIQPVNIVGDADRRVGSSVTRGL